MATTLSPSRVGSNIDMPPPGRILLVQHAANLSGSAFSGQLIAKGLKNAGWEIDVAFGFEGPGIELYQNMGCGVHVIEHKNWLRGGNFQRSLRRISAEVAASQRFVRLMRRLQPDVVYVNSLVSLAAVVAARRLKTPCVWHIRELFQDVAGEMIEPACGGRGLVRQALRHLPSQLVVISQAVAENVLGPTLAKRATVIPNAVSRGFFDFNVPMEECRQRLGLQAEVPIVGVPGTLRPVKGHTFFFRAASQLKASVPECHFAITGDGEASYREELASQVRRLGLEEQTHFLGPVQDMREFYAACEVICVPSESEPFGRTVIEAFAIGTPVVATAVGGMRETVDNKINGLLVPFRDVRRLTEALEQLIQDEDIRDRLAGAAMIAARTHYAEEEYQRQIFSLVQKTVPAGKAAEKAG